MSTARGFLLASFLDTAEEEPLMKEVEFIANEMNLTNNLIFLMHQKSSPERWFLTYNAIPEPGRRFHPRLFTMRVHRKKQTNTLYTINALNLAIAEEHDGKTGRDLRLAWETYENSILVAVGKKLQVHPIEVLKIFKIEEPPEEN